MFRIVRNYTLLLSLSVDLNHHFELCVVCVSKEESVINMWNLFNNKINAHTKTAEATTTKTSQSITTKLANGLDMLNKNKKIT